MGIRCTLLLISVTFAPLLAGEAVAQNARLGVAPAEDTVRLEMGKYVEVTAIRRKDDYVVGPYLIARVRQDRIPLDVQEFIHESERQRQIKIETILAGNLSEQDKLAAINEIDSRPYYAELHIDVPPTAGQMGVLGPQITSRKVVRIIDGSNMIVALGWHNERFHTDFARQFWITGYPTEGLAKNTELPLKGVLKVTDKVVENGSGEAAGVPVLEAIDLSRFVDQVFFKQKRFEELRSSGSAQFQDELKRTTERQAESKLKVAKALMDDGQVEMARIRFQELIRNYPGTPPAQEAERLLGTTPSQPNTTAQ